MIQALFKVNNFHENNNKTHLVEILTIINAKQSLIKATQITSHIPVVRIRILMGTTVVRILIRTTVVQILIRTTVVRIASAVYVGWLWACSCSVHNATPSFEDNEQAYIVHTGFAG